MLGCVFNYPLEIAGLVFGVGLVLDDGLHGIEGSAGEQDYRPALIAHYFNHPTSTSSPSPPRCTGPTILLSSPIATPIRAISAYRSTRWYAFSAGKTFDRGLARPADRIVQFEGFWAILAILAILRVCGGWGVCWWRG